MEEYQIAILTELKEENLRYCDRSLFAPVLTSSIDTLIAMNCSDFKLLVIDQASNPNHELTDYLSAKNHFSDLNIPVILMVDDVSTLKHKIEALEAGYSDVINARDAIDAISTRLISEIYHQVADSQLQNTIEAANQAAFSAMKESFNLGNNIQFLLRTHSCEDLDHLGLVFFQTINEYGLNCSLQMRSEFGVRNMEANGMVRALESELLSKLQGHGRYFDFAQRSVVNFGTVSVLIRNMPEDENLYGMIKDNTFTLLQGMDARVRALDEHRQLEQEKEALEHLSKSVTHVMKEIETDFHSVMKSIVTVVENMAESIEDRIPNLLLTEEQEAFVLETVNNCVTESNKVFSEGLHIDEHFSGLIKEVEETLQHTAKLTANKNAERQQLPDTQDESVAHTDVELF